MSNRLGQNGPPTGNDVEAQEIKTMQSSGEMGTSTVDLYAALDDREYHDYCNKLSVPTKNFLAVLGPMLFLLIFDSFPQFYPNRALVE
jgi:hypothetical protein